MAKSFQAAHQSLSRDSLIVIVFAHKNPDAWKTLTTAIIQAGLVITASWPIDTELQGGLKLNRAATCHFALDGMPKAFHKSESRALWQSQARNAGTDYRTSPLFLGCGNSGPRLRLGSHRTCTLESYSSYKAVKWNTGELFTVTEFLTEVRRMVTRLRIGGEYCTAQVRKHWTNGPATI